MLGIERIAGYLPQKRHHNADRIEEFSIGHDFLNDKLGVTQIAVKEEFEETSDMCVKAFEHLVKNHYIAIDTVDCLAVCTQNPDGWGLPHTSAIVHHKLNLSQRCATFDISLGCSGYVYSLSIFHAFMQANGYKHGLLFTCDPYSKIINAKDKNTALLFGDAATVTYFSEKPQWCLGKPVFGTAGKDWEAIKVGEDGRFSMQGRAVFNFAATTVPGNILETLDKNGLKKDDIDLFVLHQGSKYILDVVARRLNVPRIRMPFLAGNYGNTVSSSIPLILEQSAKEKRNILISGFGVGLSWGSLILTEC